MAGLLEALLGGGGGFTPMDFATLDAQGRPAIDPMTGMEMPTTEIKPPPKPKPYGGTAVPFASTLGLLSGQSRGYDPANDLPPSTNDPASSEPVVFSGGVPVPRPRPSAPDTDVSSAAEAPAGDPMSIAPPAPAPAPTAAAPAAADPSRNLFGGGNLFGDGMIGKVLRPENAPLLMALGGGLSGAPSIGTGMRRAFSGAVPAAMQLQQNQVKLTGQKAIYDSLIAKGVPPAEAIAAASNPDMLKIVGSKYFETKPRTHIVIKDAAGGETHGSMDAEGRFYDTAGKMAKPDSDSGATFGTSDLYAPGVKKLDPTLSGDDMLAQYHPKVQAAVKAYINGDVMPSGNPREKGISTLAKNIAQRYGQDTGVPVSDALYNQKRQLQTDLVKGSPSTVGGILKNGLSAFSHLGEASEAMAKLGNFSGPRIPGGAHVGDAGNYISNDLLRSPETAGKLQALRSATGRYGAESTKFYAGTGGGEKERLAALNEIGKGTSNAEAQASYLEMEKSLLQDRLNAQINSVRATLGQGYIDSHPDLFNPKDYQTAIKKIDENIGRLRGERAGPRKIKWSIEGANP